MLRRPLFLIGACFILLSSLSATFAQPRLTGNLGEIRILGTSPVNERLVRVRLQAREGTPVQSIDVEAERSRVLELGIFETVSVYIEDRGAGPIMFVEVTENPRIAEIRVLGSSQPTESLLRLLEEENLLAAGSLLNLQRAQEARRTLQTAYRRGGFPFEVPINIQVSPVTASDPPSVIVIYEISETVPLNEVRFEASELVEPQVLEQAFRPLSDARDFTIERYQQAVAGVAEVYADLGYRGSGVDIERTEIVDGVMTVRLAELRIGSIDTTDIGVDPAQLRLQPGDLFNYDLLLEDVRRLAQGRTRDIRIEPLQGARNEVRVVFRQDAPETAGPVRRVVIEGNTVFDDATLAQLLALRPTETFTSFLADEDFNRLRRFYEDRGYRIVSRPDYSYDEGLYTQRIQELRIRGYEVVFTNEEGGRTDETVITRYFPRPGEALNVDRIVDSFRRFAQLRIATPVQYEPVPTEAADEVIVRLVLREESAREFRPEVGYDTARGFAGAVSYTDRNLFGLAHAFSADITLQTAALGLQLGGSLSYSIPWLYIDVLDFMEVPTSVSASLFSQVVAGQPLTASGRIRAQLPGARVDPENEVFIGNYMQRDTGASFGVGRQIFANTTLSFSVRVVSSVYSLEPAQACELDAEGNVINRTCTLPEALAIEHLPQGGLSSFLNTSVVYDDRDNPDFPTRGINALSRLGWGFGTDYRDPETQEQTRYSYQQVEFGVRSYVRLFNPDEPNHILAYRVNVGHQFGANYPTARRFIVGQTQQDATLVRGYVRDDILPSRTYLTGSVEYRYNFGLDTFVTETVVGIVFIDLGYASDVPNDASNFLVSAGVGVQLNFGVGAFLLPPIRLDYGFSPVNPLGVFGFRISPVF